MLEGPHESLRAAMERSGKDDSLPPDDPQDARPSPSSRPPASGESARLVGQTLAARYRITDLIGTGGMGAVYRADHVLMHKTVAVKVLHRQMTSLEEAVRRFEREAIAAGRIEHPNVAVATDLGRLEDGSLYLVMEYVAGKSLRAILDETASVPAERTLRICRQIAAGLDAAHSLEIIHRDLKPDNVMLTDRGATGEQVKILDFGIAKVSVGGSRATELTQLGTVFGTPQYMAPEQAAGKDVDGRADLYALGLIWHEMLLGRRTFEGGDVMNLLARQMTERPGALPESVPSAVASLVFSLLEKDPDARPQTAQAVVAQIDALLGAGASRRIGPAPPSVASTRARLPTVLDRGGTLPVRDRVLDALDNLRRAARPWIRDAGDLARHRVRGVGPIWAIGVAAVGIGGALVSLGSDGEETTVDAAAAVQPEPRAGKVPTEPAASTDPPSAAGKTARRASPPRPPTDPDLLNVIAMAKRGSLPAIFALEQRQESERTTGEWLAIAQGQLRRRKIGDSLAAYGRALTLDPALAKDKTMLGGLRYFADRDTTMKPVLDFAAQHMGRQGADLLFHVWASTSRQTPATRHAWSLLETEAVRAHMSEPLRLTLDLRAAETCEAIKTLLPRIEAVGDERCRIRLRALTETRGCGPDKRDDCYPCLREDSQLDDALTQVQMRNAPRFERPRRWR